MSLISITEVGFHLSPLQKKKENKTRTPDLKYSKENKTRTPDLKHSKGSFCKGIKLPKGSF